MVTLLELWMPILLSAVLVFVAASVAWTVLPHHKNDFLGLPNERAVMDAIRVGNVQPGQYHFPHPATRQQVKDPAWREMAARGPMGTLVIVQPTMAMGKKLVQYFIWVLVVTLFVAYLASRTVPSGAEYLAVFRVTGTAAVLAYSAGVIPESIWFGRPWRSTILMVVDGVVFGLLTAGVFGWLWP